MCPEASSSRLAVGLFLFKIQCWRKTVIRAIRELPLHGIGEAESIAWGCGMRGVGMEEILEYWHVDSLVNMLRVRPGEQGGIDEKRHLC